MSLKEASRTDAIVQKSKPVIGVPAVPLIGAQGSLLRILPGEPGACRFADDKALRSSFGSGSSTVHGGGKRRLEITRRLNRRFVIIPKLLLNKINAASRLCAF